MKVCKFGGTSMANANAISRIKSIIQSDSERRFVVVSAPGKREEGDIKVTDILYEIARLRDVGKDYTDRLAVIRKRFTDIIDDLGLKLSLASEFDVIEQHIASGASVDYIASRGEYLAGMVVADYLGLEFVDAAEAIMFFENGRYYAEYTQDAMRERLKNCKGAVIPGFYGSTCSGEIKTFSRGGSDVTGAVVAQVMGASLYENWTDVDGFLTCDPRIVKNAEKIEVLTYRELRELSYMGANVLHPESIFPVRQSGIPINIKNTFNPSYKGTLIVPMGDYKSTGKIVTGIAGKGGFMSITVEKSMMNNELGFTRKLLSVLEHYNVNFEHIPTGVDTLSVVIDKSNLNNNLDSIIKNIDKSCMPDRIFVEDSISVIAVVGHGMRNTKGTACRIFTALSNADVNIKMIDQGSSEMSIILGVDEKDHNKAIKAIYTEMVGEAKD